MNKSSELILEDIFTLNSEEIYETDIARQCFNIVGVMVVAIDVNGKITLINRKGCELLNLKESEAVGKSFIDDFIVEGEKENARELFNDILSGRTGFTANTKYTMVTTSNAKRIIEAKNVAIRKNQSEIVGFLISGEDVTNYLKIQRELQDSVSLYKLLANNIPDINMYLFDNDMRYIIVEGSEMKKQGLYKDYFVGKTLHEVFDDEILQILAPLYSSALEGREISTEFVYKQNNYVIWLFPFINQENEINGGMAITQNITKDKQNSKKLKIAKEKAEEANNFKSEFIANVSHEIRTPLNAILGFTEQLLKTALDTKQEGYVKIIDKSSEHLLSLVNQVLILSKIEAGQVQLDKAPFLVSSVINEVFNTLNIKAKEKALKFVLQNDYDPDLVLVGDAFRLKQILMNVVNNAIKFTEDGHVKLVVGIDEMNKSHVSLRFDVIDTGIGISKDKLAIIFNQFSQADSAITKKFGGTGLGLTISKKLIDIQKGKIDVVSKKGKGTHFTIFMKYKRGGEKLLNNKKTRNGYDNAEKNLIKGLKVLLVDDDAINRLLGKTILEELQCDIDVAMDGGEAIEKVKEQNYDIILLDIHMPDISGVDVAKFIRKNLKMNTKIIAVTAAVIHKDIKKFKKSGIDDYLIKPFKEANLYNKICDNFDIRNVVSNQNLSVNTEDNNEEIFDLTELQTIAKGNKDFIVNMLDTFIKTTENSLNQIVIYQKQQNWKQVGEFAHKMLPSMRHLRVEKLVGLLTEIKIKAIVEPRFDEIPPVLEEAISIIEITLERIKTKKEEILNTGV